MSNWRLVLENRRLNAEEQFYASLRHTPTGIALPDLQGEDPNGRSLTISYQDIGRQTLLFVFSPTCPHCKRNWPVWLDLAKAAKDARVAFVNVGDPLPPNFSQSYSFDAAPVLAKTSPESILKYSLFEFPITIVMSPDGHSQGVWAGELSKSDAAGIAALLVHNQ